MSELDIEIYNEAPLGEGAVYVLLGDEEPEKVLSGLEKVRSRAVYIFIRGFDWNRDLSPWPGKAVFKNSPDFAGKADDFLGEITGEVIPFVKGKLKEKPRYQAIAGYSLAGLFAVYSLYKTPCFSRAVTASGSLWYGGFKDFALSFSFAGKPEKVYFSLGDREKRTKNKDMARVEESTRKIYEYYKGLGLETVFELNPGNHFQDPEGRLAKGIGWIID